jgi:hypothetical protein
MMTRDDIGRASWLRVAILEAALKVVVGNITRPS